nr:DUF4105 domain-containing protein [uncultured Rhodopila sp.]
MALVSLIGATAVYYATIRPDWLRLTCAGIVIAVAAVAILAMPFRRGVILWAVLTVAVAIWYALDRPSNTRDWAPEYAIPATGVETGRTVSLRNIRNFAYRSETEFTASYYDAGFPLDELESVDLVASYWSGKAIAHIFLTFGFRGGRHIAFSIETRRQAGFEYSTLAGFFHHYELFYVAADERDLIGVRTDIRHEQVYLYRLRLTRETREALFLSYVRKLDELAVNPEWYSTLTHNCTTGILARADAPRHIRFDWRVLLSGYAPRYAYQLGLLDDGKSYAELQRDSLIRRPPGAVIDADYSMKIRQAVSPNG